MGRIIEIIFTLFILILTFPFWIVIGILIKLESDGPVLFTQERVGKDLKIFKIYKFRTMYMDQEERLKDYLRKNQKAKKEWENYRKLRSFDPRVTKMGKILRKFSFDEIPQILNVIKGDMSLVGPRPYLKEEVVYIPLENYEIFKVKPGITGPWQVSGRNKIPFNERIRIEKDYAMKKNLFKDIGYLFKTINSIVNGEGI
uniref:Sugar transferase n=2 Tax=candidate division WOR-3 bacterium TaxID=2052148 RepID=A0A7V3ZST6_UNCW3